MESNKKSSFKFNTKDIVEIAMLVALAIVLDLSFFKIRIGQNGGSISFSMIPLFILGFRKSLFKSFIGCAVVYGLLTCLMDGYGFVTYPFDYCLGFGAISLSSLFRKKILDSKNSNTISALYCSLSIILCCSIRLLSSTISGVVIYGLSFLSSLIYNLTYIGPSSLAVIIVIVILLKKLKVIENNHPSL